MQQFHATCNTNGKVTIPKYNFVSFCRCQYFQDERLFRCKFDTFEMFDTSCHTTPRKIHIHVRVKWQVRADFTNTCLATCVMKTNQKIIDS